MLGGVRSAVSSLQTLNFRIAVYDKMTRPMDEG